jgi:hypothetical protein
MYESLQSIQCYFRKRKVRSSVRDPTTEVSEVCGDDVELDVKSVLSEWTLTPLVTGDCQR